MSVIREEESRIQSQIPPQYIVAPKKAIEEYITLDAEDESLVRWKKSLGLNVDNYNGVNSIGDPTDKRKLVVVHIKVAVEGRDPVFLNTENESEIKNFGKNPVAAIEHAKFKITIRFRIQHEILTGLRYYQTAKRGGITMSKTDHTLGAYPPNTPDKPYYEVSLPEGEAPGGLLARGSYSCSTTFYDDDKVSHLTIPWKLMIVKREK
ncbi:Rdi1p [Sugiyamaella lignohabitans]|uniref:Rdi1p n=1 Tax=Sugiyamaella lignohabitans TaxID=796027 RepID=A0A161HJ86_9ASCO|nr:Rdi1p [Sugiyamaella lignohabitans]ANB12737.1 Rdi1p [Sugiyamaella lignohabitans]